MAKISLVAKTDELPLNLISHAAKTCYTSKVPEMGATMDVENNLFKTGHHTTLQHNYFTFNISDTSISSVTFGLHLTHHFYNTDQRSGRFSKMYTKVDFDEIKNYISQYWPNENSDEVIDFIKKGKDLYDQYIEPATQLVIEKIKEERPNATEEYIIANAGKIAQEQMRMFISTIFPTALDYTINLSTLTAMYRAAWSPELRDITDQMKDLVITEYPDLAYMFDEKVRRHDNWTPKMDLKTIGVKKSPDLWDFGMSFTKEINLDLETKDSVDLRYFTPENMDNNISTLRMRIEISVATMGQDQRHRALKRGIPQLTGNFYLPPILDELGLEEVAFDYLTQYKKLISKIDKSLALAIIPYGMMVSYGKVGDLNGMIHEQEKRLCWSAQEEIYNLSRMLHEKLTQEDFKDKTLSSDAKKLAELMTPACYKTKCIEGKRYCGRDISKLREDKRIPKRKI